MPFSEETPPVTVSAMVSPIDWGLEDGYELVCAKVPQSKEPLADPVKTELIPYGCSMLRMTELPLIG